MIIDFIDYIRAKVSDKIKMLFIGFMTFSVIINVVFGMSLSYSKKNNTTLAASVEIAISDLESITGENAILNSTIGELTGELQSSIDYIIKLNREAQENNQDRIKENEALEALGYLTEEEIEFVYQELEEREQHMENQQISIQKVLDDLQLAISQFK